jgi:hypothetical protein
VDAGSVLGLSALRPAFLVDLSTTKPREGQGGLGARIMIGRDLLSVLFTEPLRVDDDELDDEDDPEDEDDDENEDDEDEEEEEDGDEPETWQV